MNPMKPILLTLSLIPLFAMSCRGDSIRVETDERAKPGNTFQAKSKEEDRQQDSATGAQTARDILAKFVKGDPGWKGRMEAMVGLVKAGPAAVPALVKMLEEGSPRDRTFAVQVLGIITDPAARPALEKALDDPEQPVRSQAVLALRMLGPLTLTDRQRQLLEKSNFHVRAHLEFALAWDDTPNSAALRKALQDYDPARIDTAQLGQLAPDVSLADLSGRTYRLSQFRAAKSGGGPNAVVLMFLAVDH